VVGVEGGGFVSPQAKSRALAAEGKFLGGRLADYERAGRLQLEVLIHEGLYPSSKVLDVGCGALRGSYWLMHFLEPECFFGIEPHPDRVEIGLNEVLEPELRERARPRFSHNDDFDLTVFGTEFDFVIARSVWTHTSKAQIQRMLDTFCEAGAPGAVMLVSYFPASRIPGAVRNPFLRLLARVPKGPGAANRVLGRVPRKDDYLGGEWQAGNVSHSYSWIAGECRRRNLSVRELDYGILGSQIWLRIERR